MIFYRVQFCVRIVTHMIDYIRKKEEKLLFGDMECCLYLLHVSIMQSKFFLFCMYSVQHKRCLCIYCKFISYIITIIC